MHHDKNLDGKACHIDDNHLLFITKNLSSDIIGRAKKYFWKQVKLSPV